MNPLPYTQPKFFPRILQSALMNYEVFTMDWHAIRHWYRKNISSHSIAANSHTSICTNTPHTPHTPSDCPLPLMMPHTTAAHDRKRKRKNHASISIASSALPLFSIGKMGKRNRLSPKLALHSMNSCQISISFKIRDMRFVLTV